MTSIRRLSWLALGFTTVVAAGCPPDGVEPIKSCPTCKYKISTGKLTGKMTGSTPPHPYSFTNLNVMVKLADGSAHPFAITSPATFAANQAVNIVVTTTITSNVTKVNLSWRAADDATVLQDDITLEP